MPIASRFTTNVGMFSRGSRQLSLCCTAVVLFAMVGCGSGNNRVSSVERTKDAAPAPGEIAFSRSAGTKQDRFPDIWVMNVDGSGQTRLTAESEAWDQQPSWSPDGNRIAFARGEITGSRETVRALGSHPVNIWVMNADGSDQTNLTDSRDSVNSGPAFSPVAEQIAFGSFDRSGSAIYVMNADGTDVTELVRGRDIGQPVWSPDGEHIAFTRRGDIYIIDANGGTETKLTDGPTFEDLVSASPAFLPNGERIAFLGTRVGAERRVIWTMGTDGDDAAPLPGRPSTGLSFSVPAPSPNGKRIAFEGDPVVSGEGIYVTDIDGGTPKRIRDTRHGDQDPAWLSTAGRP